MNIQVLCGAARYSVTLLESVILKSSARNLFYNLFKVGGILIGTVQNTWKYKNQL